MSLLDHAIPLIYSDDRLLEQDLHLELLIESHSSFYELVPEYRDHIFPASSDIFEKRRIKCLTIYLLRREIIVVKSLAIDAIWEDYILGFCLSRCRS